MPFAAFFSVLFFLTLLSLGIDSAFSLVEAVNATFLDTSKKLATKKVAFYVCFVSFVLGIIFTTGAGLYFLDLIDHFITNFGLVIVGIFEAIAIGWIFGAEKLRTYINSVSDWKVGKWWNYAIKYFVPAVLIIMVVAQFINETKENYGGYPGWAIAVGWLTVIIPIVIGIVLAIKPMKVEVNV